MWVSKCCIHEYLYLIYQVLKLTFYKKIVFYCKSKQNMETDTEELYFGSVIWVITEK